MNEPTYDMDDEDDYDMDDEYEDAEYEEFSDVDTETKIKDWGMVADYLDMVAEMVKDGPRSLRRTSSLPSVKSEMKELIKRAFIHKWQTGTDFYDTAGAMREAFTTLASFVRGRMLEEPDWAQIEQDRSKLLAEWNEFVRGIEKYRKDFEYWGSSDWSR